MINQGRGSLYDPLVVDTFVNAYSQIAPAAIRAGDESTGLVAVSVLEPEEQPASSPLRRIRISASESSLLDSHRRLIAASRTSSDAFAAAAQCLRQISPATVFAFFRRDREDHLTCEHTFGDKKGLLDGLTIPMGSRVTGWSAATRRVSINATASLDLANVADFFDPPLQSVLCIPVAHDSDVLGVMSAYSPNSSAFKETQTYAFEQIALALSDRLRSLSVVDPSRQLVFRPRSR